ncbi:hypothetical protein FQR65_LT03008 [Abscondita terminalis]|nr:hypothetical protein FQR65_LT03008 [Abscondita terminalis]
MSVTSEVREDQKSISDSNIHVPVRNSRNQKDSRIFSTNRNSKTTPKNNTFSGQYNGPISSNSAYLNNDEAKVPNTIPGPHPYKTFDYSNTTCGCPKQSYPPQPYPPQQYPPQPYPPQDDLWDLQFCRWWGWNWVRKRDEIVSRQNKPWGKRKQAEPYVGKPKRRNPKHDDFFSWCGKLFKGRQKDCPLKIQEKEQLQEMYDTPSVMSLNKCFQPSAPNWDCKSINLHRACYGRNGRPASVSTICIKNQTRREADKCNRRKHRSWVCEKCESSSSEEGCLHVCQCPKSFPSGAEESVEYLALRMECLNSDNDDNVCCFQKQFKCCPSQLKKRCSKHAFPCKLKVVCEKKNDPYSRRPKECKIISDPYRGQFSQWKCTCGRCCSCMKDTPARYPQFSRLSNKCKCAPDLRPSKKQEYIIRCPLVHNKKFRMCSCCNVRCPGCECKLNSSKIMVDKCVSCPDIRVNQAQSLPENSQKDRFSQAYKNSTINHFHDFGSLKNGHVSGRVYGLNSRFTPENPVLNRANIINRFNVHDPFRRFTDTTEIPLVDNEHNIILTAVCEAIMSSHFSDQNNDNIIEEDPFLGNFDYLFSDDSQEPNPLQEVSQNFLDKVHKPVASTDKFLGYTNEDKPYKTIPLRSVKKTCLASSRIPLLKRNHNFINGEQSNTNIYDIINKNNFAFSNSIANVINNKCEIESNFNQNEKVHLNSEKCKDGADTFNPSVKFPGSLIKPSKFHEISIKGLLSKLSNTFINKNNTKFVSGSTFQTEEEILKLNSNNLPTESTLNSPPNSLPHQQYCNSDSCENNFEGKNSLWNESLSTYALQSGTNLSCQFQFQPVSTSYNQDDSSDLLKINGNYEIPSDLNREIISPVDVEYIENIIRKNRSHNVNTGQPQNYLNVLNSESKNENLYLDLENKSYINDNISAKAGCEGCENLNKSINSSMTSIKKSRIPIHDSGLSCKLLPIVEEHNVPSPSTEKISDCKRSPCSKEIEK